MIASFGDEKTEQVFRRRYTRKLPRDVQKRIRSTLLMLENARGERDLRFLPSGELERPARDEAGPWHLRVDERWCIQFEWQNGNARAVQVVTRPR